MRQSAPVSLPTGHWFEPVPGIIRALAVGTLAGLIAGLLVGGIGSRLAMRLVVLATYRTPSQSVEGSAAIVILGVLLGITMGVVYIVVQRWLPGGWLVRGLLFGLGLLALPGASFFFDGLAHADSELREGPIGLGIALFAMLIVSFGPTVAGGVVWLERRLPAMQSGQVVWLVGLSLIGVVGAALAVLGSGLLILGMGLSLVEALTGQRVTLPQIG